MFDQQCYYDVPEHNLNSCRYEVLETQWLQNTVIQMAVAYQTQTVSLLLLYKYRFLKFILVGLINKNYLKYYFIYSQFIKSNNYLGIVK